MKPDLEFLKTRIFSNLSTYQQQDLQNLLEALADSWENNKVEADYDDPRTQAAAVLRELADDMIHYGVK